MFGKNNKIKFIIAIWLFTLFFSLFTPIKNIIAYYFSLSLIFGILWLIFIIGFDRLADTWEKKIAKDNIYSLVFKASGLIALLGASYLLLKLDCHYHYLPICSYDIFPELPNIIILMISGFIFIWLGLKKFKQQSSLIVLLIFIIATFYFIFIRINIFLNFAIGTDEANTLYVIKMLREGLTLYKDFWYREPLSVLIFKPFSGAKLDFLNLRIFVLFVYLTTFLVAHLSVRHFWGARAAWISSLCYLIFSGILAKPYLGLFNIIWFLSQTIIISLLLYYNENRKQSFLIIILGFLVGVSILNYKAAIMFWLIIPLVLYQKYFRPFKKILLFFSVSFLPLLAFWLYYASQSNFWAVYELILKKVIISFLTAFVIFAILSLIKNKLPIKHTLDIAITLSILCFLIFFIFQIILKNNYNFWPIILEGGLAFFAIILLNFIFLTSKPAKYRYLLLILWSIFVFNLIKKYYGNTGYFHNLPPGINIIILLALITLFYLIIKISIKNKTFLVSERGKIIILTANLFLIGLIFGSEFMGSRFKYFLYLSPFLIFEILEILLPQKTKEATLFVFMSLNLLFVAHFVNYYKSDYTFYSQSTLNRVKNALELKEGDKIFTADLAIASVLDNKNLFKCGSFWVYRNLGSGNERPFYWQDNLRLPLDYIAYSKNDYANLIKKGKPKYIIGSWRATIKTFFTSRDPANQKLHQILKNNYKFKENIDGVKIYILK